jgi:hypothetical protein
MAMHEGQWRFVLAPGITPASEEAIEWFTSAARTEHYEFAATEILATWPVLDYEPDQAASWTSSTPAPPMTGEAMRAALLRGDDQQGGEFSAV